MKIKKDRQKNVITGAEYRIEMNELIDTIDKVVGEEVHKGDRVRLWAWLGVGIMLFGLLLYSQNPNWKMLIGFEAVGFLVATIAFIYRHMKHRIFHEWMEFDLIYLDGMVHDRLGIRK